GAEGRGFKSRHPDHPGRPPVARRTLGGRAAAVGGCPWTARRSPRAVGRPPRDERAPRSAA
ncbi:hypothetical protein NGM37_28710, partial [Streptomyces sp. TRM76130]|nr:hypothetical protein [Streptomyces sp. TRM76130]